MSVTEQALPGTVVPSGSLVSPGGGQGLQGLQGPGGPTAVSTDAGNIATLGTDSKIYVPSTPPGAIMDYAGAAAPTGWLLCDGSAVSRTTYAALFTAISTAYGAGDGSTTFNVPDTRGRVGVGAGQGSSLTNRAVAAIGGEEGHVLSIAELAAHNHTATQPAHGHTMNDPTHSHTVGGLAAAAGLAGGPSYNVNLVLASAASATGVTTQNAQPAITVNNNGSGTAHNIMQPFIVFNKIIKT